MGRTYDAITQELAEFIAAQHVFFVASAPADPHGHVNVSPRGYDTFTIIDDHTVAWLDLTGSGVETIAHLRDSGRVTLMWCAFEGPPRVLRVHGRGRMPAFDSPEAVELRSRWEDIAGARAVIVVDVERISTSCGYGVPFMDFRADRPTLHEWGERKAPDGLADYWVEKNAQSVDGLPGISR